MRRPRVFWEGTQVWFRDSEPVGEVSRGLSPVWSLFYGLLFNPRTHRFSGGSVSKESTCKRHGFDPWIGKIPWRRDPLTTPVSLPGEFHGQRSLAGYTVHRITKSQTRLSKFYYYFRTHAES